MARPKKETSALPDGWQDTIIKLYSKGASSVEVKALLYRWVGSFSNDLWGRWLEEDEEFSETIKKGISLSNSWWEKEGRTNLQNSKFNYTGWYMNMKNRFKWRDRLDATSDDKPMSLTIVYPTRKKD